MFQVWIGWKYQVKEGWINYGLIYQVEFGWIWVGSKKNQVEEGWIRVGSDISS